MIKALVTLLAALGLALGTAGTASADEAGFITSIDSLDYFAMECEGCTQDAVSVGYEVCAAFDRGGETAAIQQVLMSYNGPGQTSAEYSSNLFAGHAAHGLCPRHDGEIGPI